MKKFLILFTIAVCSFAFTAKAQSGLLSQYKFSTDTITNTGTKKLTSPRVAGAQQTVSVTANVVSVISGTQGGVMKLYGSLDGTVFTRIRANDMRGNSAVDSLVINTGPDAQGKTWVINNSPWQYYQAVITGSGTSSYIVQGKIVAH